MITQRRKGGRDAKKREFEIVTVNTVISYPNLPCVFATFAYLREQKLIRLLKRRRDLIYKHSVPKGTRNTTERDLLCWFLKQNA